MAPIAGQEPGKIRELVRQVIESQEPQLAAAIQAGAQARVNQLKAQLTNQVANRVTSQLNRSFSFYDDWFDPVVGLRGRFNLNKAFYLTAESDVGGFGIGSDIAVQEYAGLGGKSNVLSFLRSVTGISMMTFATLISSIVFPRIFETNARFTINRATRT